eukprot:gene4974-22827_t
MRTAAGQDNRTGQDMMKWSVSSDLPDSCLQPASFQVPADEAPGFEWLPGHAGWRGVLRPTVPCVIPSTAGLILHGDGGVTKSRTEEDRDKFADQPVSTAAVVSAAPARLYNDPPPSEYDEGTGPRRRPSTTTGTLEAPADDTATVTIRGTTQEAECLQFLMQLTIARQAGVAECWLCVDSEVVIAMFTAACTGNDRTLERRQMAHYAHHVRTLLRDWPCKVVVVKQNGHSLSFGNVAADASTHGRARLVTWQRGATRYQLWPRGEHLDHMWTRTLRRRIDSIHLHALRAHKNAGWRAREELSGQYTIWGNTGLTARERQFAERMATGRLWDLVTYAHRKHLPQSQRRHCCCLICDAGLDERQHWLMECQGTMEKGGAGPMHELRCQLWHAAVQDLGDWVTQITPEMWVVLAAGGMPPKVQQLCRQGPCRPGDARTFRRRVYRLQRHAIRMAYCLWHLRTKLVAERLRAPDLLARDRWQTIEFLYETKSAQRRLEEATVEVCTKCRLCPADCYGGANGTALLCEYCWQLEEAAMGNEDSDGDTGSAEDSGYSSMSALSDGSDLEPDRCGCCGMPERRLRSARDCCLAPVCSDCLCDTPNGRFCRNCLPE